MAKSSAERVAAYRKRQKQSGEADSSRRETKTIKRAWKAWRRASGTEPERPFCGCDGEGAGLDSLGRQNFQLFRMGERELFRDGARLETRELLDFICDHPKEEILVGFAFGYDATMILRDLPPGQQERLFQPKEFKKGHNNYVWYKEFEIDYLPKQYLRVRRVEISRSGSGRETRKVIPGSTRTVYETFGFFQKSFLKVIREFRIGTEPERNRVAENKARRSEFLEIGDEERAYCALECRMLGELMDKLRDNCRAADIIPKTWNGAGKLAGALHRDRKTIKAEELPGLVPAEVLDFANMAYYGGRFEITRVGLIKEKVFEYDIRSAYPDAMRSLPCLLHGGWRKVSGKELADIARRSNDLFIASCSFKTASNSGAKSKRGNDAMPGSPGAVGSSPLLGGLPVRSEKGFLFWPMQGAGVYWSPEIRSAEKLGFEIKYVEGWVYETRCACSAFDWVKSLYDYRRSIGSAGAGYPIKLAINSLYGLLAQRKGRGKFVNLVWAGLITSLTRSKLNAAIALNPSRVVMLATDAVYSLDPLPLDCGEELGQWEGAELDGLFIVQPGLYWCPARRKRKSRGLSGKFFEDLEIGGVPATVRFEWEWKQFQNRELSAPEFKTAFPEVRVPVHSFIGLKLANARGKPELAGTWADEFRDISFDYRNKRNRHKWNGEHILTFPKRGYPGLISMPHKDFLKSGGAEPWENARAMLEEQPDLVDLGPPFQD